MKRLLLAFLLLSAACDRGPVQPYPLTICLVGGDELGKMGEAEVIVYQGREIKVCCGGCVASFKEDPARYMKVLDEAIRKKGAAAK